MDDRAYASQPEGLSPPEGVPAVSASAPRPPRRVGRYELGREIGSGSMGVVFEARDTEMARVVAIKAIRPERAQDVDLERFHREAEMMARLRHPGIASIYDMGSHEGMPYIVMNFIEGRSLGDIMKSGEHVPQRFALEVIRDAALALAHAHQHAIVHRDLKPSNILIDRTNKPVITDFGLARDLLEPSNLTATGYVVGTPLYMSPEQATGKGPVDGQSDLFSLGVILFELLTGTNPNDADSVSTVMKRAARGLLPAPSALDPRINRRIDAVVLRACDRDRARRYANATELAEAIDTLLEHGIGSSIALPALAEDVRPEAASPLWRVVGVAVTVLMIVGAAATTAAVTWHSRGREAEGARGDAPADATPADPEPAPGAATAAQQARAALRALGGSDAASAALALKAAEAAIASDPDLAEAHVMRARALTRAGERAAAFEAWERAFRIDPALVLDHVDGDLARRREDVRQRVRSWLEQAARSDDEVVRTVAAARLEMLEGDRRAERPVPLPLERLAARFPDSARAVAARAHARWAAGRWDAAIEDARALVTRWPDDGEHRARLGHFLQRRRQRDAALREIELARTLRPDLAGPLYDQASIAGWGYRTAEAEALIAEATLRAPDWAAPLVARTQLAFYRHEVAAARGAPDPAALAEAREAAERAVALEPSCAAAVAVRGWPRVNTAAQEALIDAREALALDPHEPIAHALKLQALQHLGLFEEMAQAAARWADLDADPVEPPLTHASLLFLAGQPGAAAPIARAAELAPDDPEVMIFESLVMLERDGGRLALDTLDARVARRHTELLERVRTTHPDYLDRFFRARFGITGEEALARAHQQTQRALQNIASLIARNTGRLGNDALELTGRGRLAEAERIYLELVRLEPQSPQPHVELASNLYLQRQVDHQQHFGISREEAYRRGLEHAQKALEACETSGMRAFRAPALATRALAEYRNGLLEQAARSIAETWDELQQPGGNQILDEQARQMLMRLERRPQLRPYLRR